MTLRELAHEFPDSFQKNLIQHIESQDTQIAELNRKVEILKGLCQEQTRRIDEHEVVISRHTARISKMITMLDKAMGVEQ